MAAPIQNIAKFCHLCKHHRFTYTQMRGCHNVKKSGQWKGVVGLEIHAQINTESKLFSGARNKYGSPTNSQVALFDAAFPGTLPVLNKKCVEAGVLTALALKCHINKVSKFDRKHYFYADLPAGYQITQQRQPLAVKGHVDYYIKEKDGYTTKTASIIQIQLEQDSGKSLHDEADKLSLIDLNRCGTGLMEIITEPDFSDGKDAAAFIKELYCILQKINTCDCKMEEGSLRVDANISVHKPGEPLGVRTEVKNLNSIKSVSKAIDFEISRQIKVLENGGCVENETRSFDTVSNETVPMRDKEIKQDYRFMPEPNLPPLCLFDDQSIKTLSSNTAVVNIDEIKRSLPPLPEEVRQKLEKNYGISRNSATIIVEVPGLAEYFEDVMRLSPKRNSKKVCDVLIRQMLKLLNEKKLTMKECPITAENFGRLIDLVLNEEISAMICVEVFDEMVYQTDCTPDEIVDHKKWRQVNDTEYLEQFCRQTVEENPDMVKKYQSGKKNMLAKLTSKALAATNNTGNPRIMTEIIEKLLQQ